MTADEGRNMKGADQRADFKESYVSAVAYGLSFLGKDLGEVFMYYLRIGYDLSAEETYEEPATLAEVLENILGFSAITIEKRIIRSSVLSSRPRFVSGARIVADRSPG